ncbi:MAG: STAS domain-containing protein [Planctomycetes bacterium]|nr:STAS domain-containing protein [Planctomycetota bacterium]
MAEQERMTRSVKKDGVVVTSFLATHVGIDTEHQLREELQEYIQDEQPQVLLDLSGVSYVSSGPLGLLTAIERDVSGREGRLVFCSVSAYVLETFRAAGLLRLFTVYETCEEALGSFGQSSGSTVSS